MWKSCNHIGLFPPLYVTSKYATNPHDNDVIFALNSHIYHKHLKEKAKKKKIALTQLFAISDALCC